MNRRITCTALLLLIAFGLATAHAQQRVEFERQRFDRSRFQRQTPDAGALPDPAAAAERTADPAAAAAPAPAASGPEFSFSEPAPATPASPPDAESRPAQAERPPRPAADGSGRIDATLVENPKLDDIPTRWHNQPRHLDEMLALQRETGATILIYFKNITHTQQKGLCSWFERRITTDIKWRRAMRHYLKLEFILPGNSAVQEIAQRYQVNHTPTLIVIPPNGRPSRLAVFQYQQGQRPELVEIDELLTQLKERSSPFYRTLF